MSEPMDRDLDQALSGWMQSVAPVRAPGRLLEDTFSRTVATGQSRNVPWGGIHVAPRRPLLETPAGWIAIGVAIALVAGLVFGTGLLGQAGPTIRPGPSAPSPSPSTSAPPSQPPADSGPPPVTVAPTASISIQTPMALALAPDGRALWVLTEDSKLARIDPVTNTITSSGSFGPPNEQWQGLAVSADALWVTDWDTGQVYKVDPTTLKGTVIKIPTAGALKGVLATSDAIWIADTHAGTVIRLDPRTNKVIKTITVGPAGNSGPNWLASGLGSIWVDIPNSHWVSRIDPATNAIQSTIPTGALGECSPFGIAPDGVWVTECFDGTYLSRIDPTTNELRNTVDLGGSAGGVTMIDGKPWVAVDHGRADNGQLIRADPQTGGIDRVLVPGTGISGGGDLVVIGDSVWFLDGGNNRVLKLPLSAFTA
jgi:streptogramin lyase